MMNSRFMPIHEGKMTLTQITVTTLTLLSLINMLFYLGNQEIAGTLTFFLGLAWAIGAVILAFFGNPIKEKRVFWSYCAVSLLRLILPNPAYAIISFALGLILAAFVYNVPGKKNE